MSIGEFCKIKKENFRFQWETVRLYYRKSWRFALADLALGAVSLFFNPYRICRKRGYVYGETPPSMLHRIAAFSGLASDDSWLELGSGRGKGCMWVAELVGCRTIGLEKVPLFYYVSQAIRWVFRLKRVSYLKGDMGEADFRRATFVYLYSTCMSEETLSLLARKMEALPPGAKVVSVSSPLPEMAHLEPAGSFPLTFPWGDTEGYLHIRSISPQGSRG